MDLKTKIGTAAVALAAGTLTLYSEDLNNMLSRWEGRWEEACDAFAHAPSGRPVWSYVGQVFYRGLYNRALDRKKLCLSDLQ